MVKIIFLSFEERQKIEKLLYHGFSFSKIAKSIGRSKHCIQNEMIMNGGREVYDAKIAQESSEQRRLLKEKSASKKSENIQAEILPQVQELHNKGFGFWEIRKTLKIGVISLMGTFRRMNVPIPHTFSMIEKLEDKVSALEQQIEIILDMIKENKC